VVHTLDDHGLTRLNFLDSRGYIYFGTESGSGNVVASIVRSVDNGLTFTKVLTVESSAPWYMIEDDNGDLLLNEYSTGSQNSLEKYAYHVWKSTDDGENWTKFYSHPPQSTPGAKDSIRHIHLLARDSEGTKYISFGETGWGTDGGSTFVLNDNGTLGQLITTIGNGMTAGGEAENGDFFFATDGIPNGVYLLNKQTNTVEKKVDLTDLAGIDKGSDVFDFALGKHGVLYGLLHGAGGVDMVPPSLIASADNGMTWIQLKFLANMDNNSAGIHLTLNKNYQNSRLYISLSVAPYISIPDYTKAQLKSLYTSTLTIKGTIS
jgi:hypothetical protein